MPGGGGMPGGHEHFKRASVSSCLLASPVPSGSVAAGPVLGRAALLLAWAQLRGLGRGGPSSCLAPPPQQLLGWNCPLALKATRPRFMRPSFAGSPCGRTSFFLTAACYVGLTEDPWLSLLPFFVRGNSFPFVLGKQCGFQRKVGAEGNVC